jgi:phosphate transport system permease protein
MTSITDPPPGGRGAEPATSGGGNDPAGAPPRPRPPRPVPPGRRPARVEPDDGGSGLASGTGDRGDRIFRALTAAASVLVLVIMAAIGAFLVYRAIPALAANTANFGTEQRWNPDAAQPRFGIAAALYFTLLTSVIAVILAVPAAVGVALFITFLMPRRVRAGMGYLVELLAAVPSIVYGLWGFTVLAPNLSGLVSWLDRWFGWTVVLRYRPDNEPNSYSPLAAGIVLAIMILPIISSLSREVFRRVPREQVEAALGIGATRWEMIRMTVLPVGRAGVTSASLLGLGRALAETLAVTMVLSTAYNLSVHITESGGVTLASIIVLKYGEAGEVGTGALVAAGLCLFVITLAVNFAARMILGRGKVGSR